jgi:hypothetical protein
MGKRQHNARLLPCLGGSAGDLFVPALTLAIDAGGALHPIRGLFRRRILDVDATGVRTLSRETLYRSESGRVLATLVPLLEDLDLAEEAMHEVFAAVLLGERK